MEVQRYRNLHISISFQLSIHTSPVTLCRARISVEVDYCWRMRVVTYMTLAGLLFPFFQMRLQSMCGGSMQQPVRRSGPRSRLLPPPPPAALPLPLPAAPQSPIDVVGPPAVNLSGDRPRPKYGLTAGRQPFLRMYRPKVSLKDRQQLYKLIISQLLYDGYINIANGLINEVKPQSVCAPSEQLLHLIKLGMENDDSAVQYAIGRSDTVAPGTGIDLEFDADVQTMSPEASEYETCYVTSHKGPCRVATYSRDGQLIATGSADASIKILDTERMLAKSAMPIEVMMNETAQQNMENHPVIRTLYDHVDEVTCLAFHPTEQILASGSRDYTLKLFDYSKPSAKRAFKYIQEAEMLRSISFHPSGDFILVGTQHPTLRLYDVNTFQCFVSCNPQDQHTDAICSVNYNASANLYVTGSKDGCIKLWDGVSNRCITTFEKAHDGAEVCSAIFSKNSKYILSSGKDSVAKLWEISTGRTLVKYTGAGLSGRQVHRTQAVFNHTEDYVLLPDERTISLCCWDSRTAERRNLLSLGHNSIVRCIVHSPTNPGFMTCSDDYRARFWYRRSTTD
ncbi:cleavage stimulation factor subunit 1-like isoform X2 [Rhineura floridana]|uniref:cleavage stimulation factor subunit 1-like isoform X2 n=1 Tax=Rhineura floridana TaxID=261503 RepID=UPI002AC7EFAE|nr:cleavage stimulation factor subunit 1-like isoform X2 [Rhineura floridana]